MDRGHARLALRDEWRNGHRQLWRLRNANRKRRTNRGWSRMKTKILETAAPVRTLAGQLERANAALTGGGARILPNSPTPPGAYVRDIPPPPGPTVNTRSGKVNPNVFSENPGNGSRAIQEEIRGLRQDMR